VSESIHADDLAAYEQEEYLAWLDAEFGLELWSRAENGLHAPTDITPFLTGDAEPPAMLIRTWLVRGVLHLLYSDAEAGKTWVALQLALDVMCAGNRVVWVDEELGPRDLAGRLQALGATPEDVRRKFVYLDFPGWLMTQRDPSSWNEMLRTLAADTEVPLGLVVIDTVTDALANADVNENAGDEVTRWIKAFPERATDLGVTTLLLDHTGKDGKVSKHAVGSRAKRSKAKVQYGLTAKRSYDRTRLGVVRVTLTKNTLGAEIPRERELTMGGEGTGEFIIRPRTMAESLATDDETGDVRDPLEARILERLQADGEMTTTQIRSRVSGRTSEFTSTLARMVETGQLTARTVGRATAYSIVDSPDDADNAGEGRTRESTE
jgi:hypothetical protein